MGRLAHGGHKTREGKVVSDKMDKTVVVAVASSVRHRLYKKIVRRLRRYKAHDETNDAKLGDRVRIVESRPYSRHKRWQLIEVLIRADRPEVAPEEIDLELLGEVKAEEEAAPEVPEAEAEPEVAEEPEEEKEPEAEEEPEAAAKPEVAEEPEAEKEPEAEEEPEASEEPEAEKEPEAEEDPEAAEEQEAKEEPEAEAEEAEGEEKEGSS